MHNSPRSLILPLMLQINWIKSVMYHYIFFRMSETWSSGLPFTLAGRFSVWRGYILYLCCIHGECSGSISTLCIPFFMYAFSAYVALSAPCLYTLKKIGPYVPVWMDVYTVRTFLAIRFCGIGLLSSRSVSHNHCAALPELLQMPALWKNVCMVNPRTQMKVSMLWFHNEFSKRLLLVWKSFKLRYLALFCVLIMVVQQE